MVRSFIKVMFSAASCLLLAACNKQQICNKKNIFALESFSSPQETSQDLSNTIPVLGRADQLSHQKNLKLDQSKTIKRFSHEAFSRKNVQLTPSIDFPIPLNFSIQTTDKYDSDKMNNRHGICLSYEGNLSLKKTILFYEKQLKASSWSHKNLSTSHEGLIICSSKQQHVVISVRHQIENLKKKTQILLFFKKDNQELV